MEKPNKSPDKPAATETAGFPKRADLAASRRRTLRLKVSNDGTPEFQGLSREQKDNWREVLSHPATAKALDLESKPPIKEEIPLLPPEQTGMLWDIILALAAWGVAGFYKAPRAVAVECFSLDETDKAILVPPTQQVISKYAPELMMKYSAEVSLLLALGCVMKEKTGLLRLRMIELAAAEKKLKEEKAAGQGETVSIPALKTQSKPNGEVEAIPSMETFELPTESPAP